MSQVLLAAFQIPLEGRRARAKPLLRYHDSSAMKLIEQGAMTGAEADQA